MATRDLFLSPSQRADPNAKDGVTADASLDQLMPMHSGTYHLAQINIARMRAPLDDPLMADFVAQLAPINALAEQSPGFVWRLQSEEGDATSLRVFEDERILINMSVWVSLEALQDYVYQSAHRGVLRDRKRWFERLDGPSTALWWVLAGHLPTAEEGKQRLERLARQGPSPDAFTFRKYFLRPDGQSESNILVS